MLIIHTDGACSGNPGPGGWSAFWEHNGQSMELLGGAPGTTNNRMELEAPLRALEWLIREGFSGPLVVRSDSQYVVKGLNEWRKGWERRQWRASTGEPVKNADLWRPFFAAVDHFKGQARFEWVRGHNGDPGNERADLLAREGLFMARSRGPGAWVRSAQGLHPLKT